MNATTLQRIAACTARERELLKLVEADGVSYPGSVAAAGDKLAALRAAVEALQSAGVTYALIGGVAVGLRSGVARATSAVEFAVPTDAPWEQLSPCLEARGFIARGVYPHSRNYRHESGEPVQFAFDEQFDSFVARAESITLADFELRVVTREDLIAMKRSAAEDPSRRRSKALRDQADIALLEGDVSDEDEGW